MALQPSPIPSSSPAMSGSCSEIDELEDDPRQTEAEILNRIHRLHLQLESVRGEPVDEDDEAVQGNGSSIGSRSYTRLDNASAAQSGHNPRLIVVSNRLPVTVSKTDKGEWNFRVSSGGLVSALAGVKNQIPFVWVGWTGMEIAASEQEEMRAKLSEEKNCYPVFLSEGDANLFYNGFCNDVLWPLFHYVPLPIVSSDGERKFDYKYWDAYSKANHRFADAVMQIYEPGDLIWVQDYHLMLLPSLLRKRVRDVTIGFFLHTPFPSSEVYRILPVRNYILQGVLAADLIGFHTYDYARHFLSVCTRILGLEASPKGVTFKDHFANVGIFPIGIDPKAWTDKLQTTSVKERILDLEDRFKGKKVLLGVDRLDYIKGVPHKLMAFEVLLSKHPEWKDKVVLVQIGVPSRTEVDEYKKLISQTNELVGRINAQYGSVENAPIVFINQSVNFDDLCALYYIADVAVVTSIRDGMNLVSYEYVACQQERHGVLVLSEFAGSAQSLSSAIRVNPWNTEEVASAMHEALSVSERERALKHWKLFHYVNKHTAAFWAGSFVTELQQIERLIKAQEVHKSKQSLLRVSIDLLPELRQRKKRLFILEYEGTLCHPAALPDLAAPSVSIRRFLQRLCADRRNLVYLMSGRSAETLEGWFGDLDIGMVSEQGCAIQHPGETIWEPTIEIDDQSWRASVLPILQYFTERTPGSHLEQKERTITWHFRDADPMFGSWQAKELQLLLAESCLNLPVEVISGLKHLELRPIGASRVGALQKILSKTSEDLDFTFAMGSDKADEDLFSFLNQYVRSGDGRVVTLTCRVGGKSDSSSAERYIPDPDTAMRMLRELGPALNPASAKKDRASAAMSSGILRKENAATMEKIQRINSVQRSRSYESEMNSTIERYAMPKSTVNGFIRGDG